MPKINFVDLLVTHGLSVGDAHATMIDVRSALRRALDKGMDVSIPGVGILHVVGRAARVVKNPYTGEPIDVPARRGVIFRPAADLKRALNCNKEEGE